jgi:hypothetical protein
MVVVHVDDAAAGAAACATSWVLFAVGSPVPISRNWRMPSASASWRTVLARNARLAWADIRMPG